MREGTGCIRLRVSQGGGGEGELPCIGPEGVNEVTEVETPVVTKELIEA